MSFDPHKNLAWSTVATPPSPATSGTSLTVASGDGGLFPDPATAGAYNLTVQPAGAFATEANAEIVRVTARSGDTFTITRTQEGTSARTIVAGDVISASITAKIFTDIEAAIGSGGGGSGIDSDGWIDDTAETWTYGSFSAGPPAVGTFTVPGDRRAKYTVGTRIKLTQSSTVKYFVVSADPTYDGTNTTVSVTGGTDYTLANSAISLNYHSYVANPQGYPTWFRFNAALTGVSVVSAKSRFTMIGRQVMLALDFDGATSNATTKTITLPITPANISGMQWIGHITVEDGSLVQTLPGEVIVNANNVTASLYKTLQATATPWTASGACFMVGSPLSYEV